MQVKGELDPFQHDMAYFDRHRDEPLKKYKRAPISRTLRLWRCGRPWEESMNATRYSPEFRRRAV